jgi:hypothetical protein
VNRDQIIELLQIISAYDGRKPDGLTLAAWTEAAGRARWDFRSASEAVHQHYVNSTAWLMPGHVTELVRAGKRQPAPVSEVLALGVAPPASPERRAEVMRMVRELAERKGLPNDPTPTPKSGLEGSQAVVQDMPVSRDYPDITEPRRTHE